MLSSLLKNKLNTAAEGTLFAQDKLATKIVHIGCGAFHRGHQALITHNVASISESDWGLCEVSLFTGQQIIKNLRAQGHLYSVTEKSSNTTKTQVIGTILESLHPALDGIEAILNKMAEPQVAIVSLTVTEKGYCIEPGSGRLDMSNPMIIHDLQFPEKPTSAIAVIVGALNIRKQNELPAFSVLSCDNIPENGKVVQAAIIDFAQQRDVQLANWIKENVSFPSTMVDRIVPAVTDQTLAEIQSALGEVDPCGVVCEPFLQWVIEDNFVSGRPQWELAGAELVEDVLPYEKMKLRMLNGSHSFLAYLGYLAGYEHISDTMQNPEFKQAAYHLMMKEQAPTLSVGSDIDLEKYAELLVERYCNSSLKHRTWQIAMDGSQKLPQRMLESVRWHIANGNDYPFLAAAIAAWLYYIGGVDEKGCVISVKDPLADIFIEIYKNSLTKLDAARSILNIKTIFGEDLSEDRNFKEAVLNKYSEISLIGSAKCIENLLKNSK